MEDADIDAELARMGITAHDNAALMSDRAPPAVSSSHPPVRNVAQAAAAEDDVDDESLMEIFTQSATAQPSTHIATPDAQKIAEEAGHDSRFDELDNFLPNDAELGNVLRTMFTSVNNAHGIVTTALMYGQNIVLSLLHIHDQVVDNKSTKLQLIASMDIINKNVHDAVRKLVDELNFKHVRSGESETLIWSLFELAMQAERVVSYTTHCNLPSQDSQRHAAAQPSALPVTPSSCCCDMCSKPHVLNYMSPTAPMEAAAATPSNAARARPYVLDTVPTLLPFGIQRETPLKLSDACAVRFDMEDEQYTCYCDRAVGLLLCLTHRISHPAAYIRESSWFEKLVVLCIQYLAKDAINATGGSTTSSNAGGNVDAGASSSSAAVAPESDIDHAISAFCDEPFQAKLSETSLTNIVNKVLSSNRLIVTALRRWVADFCVTQRIMQYIAQKYNP